MLAFNDWKQFVRESLLEISDEAFQKKYWIEGDSQVVSSFEETISRLYDDLNFEDFIRACRSEENGLDETLVGEITSFSNMLNRYLDSQPKFVDPKVIVNDKEWGKIRLYAKKIAGKLS